jgi:hypothetical protein
MDRPAFPSTHPESKLHNEGMSLREWYAGLALEGIIAATEGHSHNPASVAERAFELADAMMLELGADS